VKRKPSIANNSFLGLTCSGLPLPTLFQR
jgi:hypothetical protein